MVSVAVDTLVWAGGGSGGPKARAGGGSRAIRQKSRKAELGSASPEASSGEGPRARPPACPPPPPRRVLLLLTLPSGGYISCTFEFEAGAHSATLPSGAQELPDDFCLVCEYRRAG